MSNVIRMLAWCAARAPWSLLLLLAACGSSGSRSSTDRRVVTVTERASVPSGVHGMAVSDDGTLWLADTFGNAATERRVYRLEPPYDGILRSTRISGVQPSGLAWYEGSLLVCDPAEGSVTRWSGRGELEFRWDAASPWNVASLPDGSLLTISYDGRVQRLEARGSATTLFDGLEQPFDLAAARDGTLWISDRGPESASVTRRDMQGNVLESIEYPWANPQGLHVDSEGLWIADSGRGELVYYSQGEIRAVTTGLSRPIAIAGLGPNGLLVNEAAPPTQVLSVEWEFELR